MLAIHLKRFKYVEHLERYKKLSYRVPFAMELRLPAVRHRPCAGRTIDPVAMRPFSRVRPSHVTHHPLPQPHMRLAGAL